MTFYVSKESAEAWADELIGIDVRLINGKGELLGEKKPQRTVAKTKDTRRSKLVKESNR